MYACKHHSACAYVHTNTHTHTHTKHVSMHMLVACLYLMGTEFTVIKANITGIFYIAFVLITIATDHFVSV